MTRHFVKPKNSVELRLARQDWLPTDVCLTWLVGYFVLNKKTSFRPIPGAIDECTIKAQ